MRITKEISTISLETLDIICNKCGQTCKTNMNYNGLLEVEISGSYDSTHLHDLALYQFSLCEKCLVELFETFVHQPIVYDPYNEPIELTERITLVGDEDIVGDIEPEELTEKDIEEVLLDRVYMYDDEFIESKRLYDVLCEEVMELCDQSHKEADACKRVHILKSLAKAIDHFDNHLIDMCMKFHQYYIDTKETTDALVIRNRDFFAATIREINLLMDEQPN